MNEEPTTQELRLKQEERERAAREHADRVRGENDTAQFDRRADKAAYLRKKLEERARAERDKAEREKGEAER
jgi:hypothetical protein